MSTRIYELDYSKFIKINKKSELENTGKCSLNEEEGFLRDLLIENPESTILYQSS